jgi:hypothetical protein
MPPSREGRMANAQMATVFVWKAPDQNVILSFINPINARGANITKDPDWFTHAADLQDHRHYPDVTYPMQGNRNKSPGPAAGSLLLFRMDHDTSTADRGKNV